MTRLSLGTFEASPSGVARPGYDPTAHGVGIVHLGCGAFHRAHQAVVTDDALAAKGGDWRIAAVSLRSSDVADAMTPQDGLFTLLEKGEGEPKARIIGSIANVIAANRDIEPIVTALADPATKIVSITVTEKAYGIDRARGDIDESHPAIASDLKNPHAPTGVLGLIVEGLRRRFDTGTAAFTVLCCDNLPDNGRLVRMGVIAFASRLDGRLAKQIETEVAFPSSMVDRITPASTKETVALAERLTGLSDEAAIETEPFFQWVIEDRFPEGRPAWEAGGALFVADVAPYERMKLRMLNGAHSMLAYTGFLAGHTFVRDVMADKALAALVRRHLKAAAGTLPELPGIDLSEYANDLVKRFENPSIAHRTYQIAMDGSEKLPQRIVAPALDAMDCGQSIRPFAFAVAAWIRYCVGRTDDGESYELRDPREKEIRDIVEETGQDTSQLMSGLLSLPGLFDRRFAENPHIRTEIADCLRGILNNGIETAIITEAEG